MLRGLTETASFRDIDLKVLIMREREMITMGTIKAEEEILEMIDLNSTMETNNISKGIILKMTGEILLEIEIGSKDMSQEEDLVTNTSLMGLREITDKLLHLEEMKGGSKTEAIIDQIDIDVSLAVLDTDISEMIERIDKVLQTTEGDL